MDKQEILTSITFGARVAEDEADDLATYFVETDQWRRLFSGDIDVVYGAKGSGKSALYSLLQSKRAELRQKQILLLPGENPRGTPAFRGLVADPPAEESEFVALWKLYFAVLLHAAMVEANVTNAPKDRLQAALENERLVKGSLNLSKLVKTIKTYVRRMMNPKAFEFGPEFDSAGNVTKVTGRIVMAEPDNAAEASGTISVDGLLDLANEALTQAKQRVWVLLDRLDVAFFETPELEANALRGLFRAYLDSSGHTGYSIKIFLRDDIWKRISKSGFREASHITRCITIKWDNSSLPNLVVRRALHNRVLREAYGVEPDLALRDVAEQRRFLYRMCPNQVDIGEKKPTTFDWMLSRTSDGTKANAPRELIHLLNSLRESQVRSMEIGEEMPEGDCLFSRQSFKSELPEVSKARLEQTLYAEYPWHKDIIEKLRGEKAQHTPMTLAGIWDMPVEEATARAAELASIGFFEAIGPRQRPEFRVPFLYRDALDLVQGSAK